MGVKFNPNYLCYHMFYLWLENRDKINPKTGKKSLVTIFNQGGTRSGKTYDFIHALYKILDANREAKLYVSVYRSTLVKARDTTLKDFIECFDKMNLVDGVDYELTGGKSNGRPIITLFGNTIEFKGLPETAKEAGRSDICFINELLENSNKDIIRGIIQRCEMLFIADWNPSLTEHWAFHLHNNFNVFYTQTSYLDNKHVKETNISEYESWCPWDFKDSHIEKVDATPFGDGFFIRIWDKPERPENILEDNTGKYRADNEYNKSNGTIDRRRWLVYGEGLSAPQDGAIFKDVKWIDKFPEEEIEEVYFGLDFGFSVDPSVLTRVGVSGRNLFVECMAYQCTPDVDTLFDLISPQIEKEVQRQENEAINNGIKDNYLETSNILIACDSSDKYRDTPFVPDLNNIAERKGLCWQFEKVKKPHIVTRISLAKRFNLHFVVNDEFKIEQQNYVYKKGDNGNPTNIPIDEYNHIFDSWMYATWKYLRWKIDDDK